MNLKMVFTFAIRNIKRAKSRSVLVIFLIASGCFCVLTFFSFSERVLWGVRESVINSQSGHIQLVKKGYWTERFSNPRAYMISNYDEIKRLIEENLPDVRIVTKRLEFSGLIANGASTAVFTGVGVEPEKDSLISSFDYLADGRSLFDNDKYKVIMGDGLAKAINAGVDDVVIAMTTTQNSSLNATDLEVVGLFSSDSEDYNGRALKVTYEQAQKLLKTQDVSRIIVLLDNTEKTDENLAIIKKVVNKHGLDISIKSWKELNPSYDKIKQLYTRIFVFVGTMICLLIMISLVSTTIMNILERVREISLMEIMGTQKTSVKILFFAENLLITILGLILSIVLFEGIFYAINVWFGGIPMPPPPGSTQSNTFFLELPYKFVLPVFISSVAVMLVATYVALNKVNKIEVSEALRYG